MTMIKLAPAPQSFVGKKQKILDQLSAPDADYTDASPKGSVDVGIRDLIDRINQLDGFVTTSSCAGRISVFVEGTKAAHTGGTSGGLEGVDQGEDSVGDEDARKPTVAGVGGKGGGGTWSFVSHDPVAATGLGSEALLGLESKIPLQTTGGRVYAKSPSESRLIHFKFEPMILHVLTASLDHAQLILKCGLQAGFRESGAVNLAATRDDESVTPMVAIRSMGLGVESLIGVQSDDGDIQLTVSSEYLQTLLDISNDRFAENKKRIERFQNALLQAMESEAQPRIKKDGTEWEDTDARRERKRAEGLRRKAAVNAQRSSVPVAVEQDPLDHDDAEEG